MSSRGIKIKREDSLLTGWEHVPEKAPSAVEEAPPVVARGLLWAGFVLVVIGTLAMFAPLWNPSAVVSPSFGFFASLIGTCFILYHAFTDSEQAYRRMYAGFAVLGTLSGVASMFIPGPSGVGHHFPTVGLTSFFFGWILGVAVLRFETDATWRSILLKMFLIIGGGLSVFSLMQAFAQPEFVAGRGSILLLVGLVYFLAFISMQDSTSEADYYGGLILGAVGLAVMVFALARSLAGDGSFFVPAGITLLGVGVTYLLIAFGICSDLPVVVLARRELASFFYSPIAYLVLLGNVAVAGVSFLLFIENLLEFTQFRGGMLEPIIMQYIFGLFPVIVLIFLVPVITMRTLSEEQRTGTLEVMLTAPVNEVSVVLGKFIAAWIFFLLNWIPWWLFLAALRVYGGEPFNYRPALSFNLVLAITGAGFVSMGVFCSSLTKNQIIAAVLTFVGMMLHLTPFLLQFATPVRNSEVWTEVRNYVSFLDLWSTALRGTIAPRFMLFHISLTVFFLYLSVKVLEARKWK